LKQILDSCKKQSEKGCGVYNKMRNQVKIMTAKLLIVGIISCGVVKSLTNRHGIASSSNRKSWTNLYNANPSSPSESTRRCFLVTLTTSASAAFLTTTSAQPSFASVYVDPDRYGDKELKIATVNKLRQNVRDAILSNPRLAPLFLKIAIQDALTYNAETKEGGPDGSVLTVILDKNAPESVLELKPAAEKLAEIAKKLKRTTEITDADVVGFAGAEAIETAGGPRIVIQLGKLDPKKKTILDKEMYPKLCGSGANVIAAFNRAGLTEREVALLFGAIGAMEDVADSAAQNKDDEEEDEENEMGDKQVFIPSSFGAPNQIYGKQLGKIDVGFLKRVAADLKQRKKPVTDIYLDEKVAGFVFKYANNNVGFLKDLGEAYTKLTALGTRYTGGKVGSLLGGQDPSV